ncbi:hypothetical protein FA13DRAFT_1712959 [Coprinellus micaceus]|uniref:Uncharacterized protein n=1 Tax=Coprinellus micaceus TaxID=71717 RepID=A0A4Y7SYJ4_COPMI|nr:hypothetical protein FA13DRAFT_1712959 [Coprinellus micaceus]
MGGNLLQMLSESGDAGKPLRKHAELGHAGSKLLHFRIHHFLHSGGLLDAGVKQKVLHRLLLGGGSRIVFRSPAPSSGPTLLGGLAAACLVSLPHDRSLITDWVLHVSGLAKSRASFVRDAGHTRCRGFCGKDTFVDPPSGLAAIACMIKRGDKAVAGFRAGIDVLVDLWFLASSGRRSGALLAGLVIGFDVADFG